mmetsp:Transcript_22103/g.33407  ORF Transcript_22103/g.33407 Transcript_22103/m.33407 type:complete len:146 (-) Transcript_22103:85-522(-)
MVGLTYEDEIREYLEQSDASMEDSSSGGRSDESDGTINSLELDEIAKQDRRMSNDQLLDHVMACNSPTCKMPHCAKMKSHLQHGKTCKIRYSGGCKICKRIWTMLQHHALSCDNMYCRIPQCMVIRAKIRELEMGESEDFMSVCL